MRRKKPTLIPAGATARLIQLTTCSIGAAPAEMPKAGNRRQF